MLLSVANLDSQDTWNFLQEMNVPVNSLHSQGSLLIDCKPCIMAVLPWHHDSQECSWLEDTKAEECGLRDGNYIKREVALQLNLLINRATGMEGNSSVTGIFSSQHLVLQSRCCRWGGSPLCNCFPWRSSEAIKCLSKKTDIDLLMAFIDIFDNGIHEQSHDLLAEN